MILMRNRGVTLIELIMVIAITGIIAAAVAIFIRRPVEGYIDAARRAALTDEADTALRRITRDLRLALPNSIRVDATGKFIEFLETSGGGRYRAEKDITNSGETLDFTAPDMTFDVIGPVATPNAGDQIVVYNLYSSGIDSNAYNGGNRAAFTSFSAPTFTIASKQFPAESPGKRFHVVTGPVTYGCINGQLVRYWNYPIAAAQATPPAGGSSAVLAGSVNVGACQFVFQTSPASERLATVSMILQIDSPAAGGDVERVRMFQQAHVSNVP